MQGRVGTIIHGALGDCYEQLCCLKLLKEKFCNSVEFIAFFVVADRLEAMQHFKLDMLSEIYHVDEINNVDIDYFHQYQINDIELNELVFSQLGEDLKKKFNFTSNIKPWLELREHDYSIKGLSLELSEAGKQYSAVCDSLNAIDNSLFDDKFTVGYLWRYRKGGAIKPYLQRSSEWILNSKSSLFNLLIDNYNAHIFVCGMGKDEQNISAINSAHSGVVKGEYLSKYSSDKLEIPEENSTYLKGLGFAAELYLMSRCDLLLMMPSGFSEPLWMMQGAPTVMVDPPPVYVAKLWWNRMPFFDHDMISGKIFNTLLPHTPSNIIRYLNYRGMLGKQ